MTSADKHAMHADTVTLSDPIPGRITLGLGQFDHTPAGYLVEERFVSGTARAYHSPAGAARELEAIVAATASYQTRLVVVRPSDPARFNGTVIVEWLNVTGGTDAAPDWAYLNRELLRRGYAYVAVSAQKGGLLGGGIRMPGMMMSVKNADPDRYHSLIHPGDAYSFDIFSQVGRALRVQTEALLGPLVTRHVLAVGQSQSAAFLTTYFNAIDPLAKVFDGALIHSRFAGSAPLKGNFASSMIWSSLKHSLFRLIGRSRALSRWLPASARRAAVESVRIRSDVRVPVLMFITETDLVLPGLGFVSARQADAPNIRTWEVAGSAHADSYLMAAMEGGALHSDSAPIDRLVKAFAPADSVLGRRLARPMNSAPQHHYVLMAALAALRTWVAEGRPPESAPLLCLSGTLPPMLLADAVGNATGGIRSPWIDVPIARMSGVGQSGSIFAALFGVTEPFDQRRLLDLYPNGRADYLDKFAAALNSAISNGHILVEDKTQIAALAAATYPG
jgi:Alpha/beta hydrolase domain